MKRYCLALDLIDNPALIAEYEALHRKVWPGIINSIHKAGILHLEMYRTGNRLFMIMDTSDQFSFQDKTARDAANPEVQEWEQLMWKYQQALPLAKPGEKWMLMDKFFESTSPEAPTKTLFNLHQQSAIITGAGSGIGKAIALLFARQGAHVLVMDINEAQANATVQEIQAANGQATALVCNVAIQEEVKTAIAGLQKVDILVNSAGVSHIGRADNTMEADMDRIYAVNIKGVYNCIHATLPLLQQHGGVILNLASVAGSVGIPDRFAYSMSKGAVTGITLSVARDYLKQNIRCNCISPGRVHTPFVDNFLAKNYPGQEAEMFEKLAKTQPIGRMGTPEEIAYLALYLCSPEAAFITGCDYPIDGGFITLNN